MEESMMSRKMSVNSIVLCYNNIQMIQKERREFMITEELTQKIDTLSKDEYHMVEIYVDNVLEYSRRKKEVAWERVKSDLKESENRMIIRQ